MPEHIFEIEPVKRRVVALLQANQRPMTTGQVCLELQLPFYAVDRALDVARGEHLVQFAPGVGWEAMPAVPEGLQGDDEGGTLV